MDERKKRAIEVMQLVQLTLLNNRDPIGVKDEPGCVDEYDMYAGGVYRLLASGATEQEIAEHLTKIERETIGFPRSVVENNLPVAVKLKKLDIRSRR